MSNSAIKTLKTLKLTLDLELQRPYIWKFTVARMQQPIIGADFLKHHSLLVDLTHNRRLHKNTETRTNKHDYPIVTTVGNGNGVKYDSLLKRYIDVTRPT